MKLSASKETLLEPLQKVVSVVERKQTIPILANVLIRAVDGELSFTTMDKEIELCAKIDFMAEEEGEVTLSARKLHDICKNLPEESTVNLTQKDNNVLLQSGRSRFKLSTLPAKDFPVIDDVQSTTHFSIPQSKLKNIIEKAVFAMANQDVRYYLNGLMIELSENTVRVVATDGHRLALCETKTDFEGVESRQVIMPRKGVLELLKILDNTEIEAQVVFDSNHVRVNLPKLRFTSKLVDGRFPDYRKVIPVDGDRFIDADKSELKQALARTSVLSGEAYRGVRFIVEGNLLTVQTSNPEQEEAEEELEVQFKGEKIEIGFNINYVQDVLNALQEDVVTIMLKDTDSSCVIQEIDGDTTKKYVIMPMRL